MSPHIPIKCNTSPRSVEWWPSGRSPLKSVTQLNCYGGKFVVNLLRKLYNLARDGAISHPPVDEYENR